MQGVFFRASTQEKALELGLVGFVRNEPNGNVYLEVEGERVDELVAWIKAGGPKMARVDGTRITKGEKKAFCGFDIVR